MVARTLVLVACFGLAAGCTKPTSDEAVLARLASFTERMCACPDQACAQTVQAELTQWSASLRKPDAAPAAPQLQRMTELGSAYAACLTKILAR